MTPSASIIVPTRGRPSYLAVALAAIAPQATAAGAEVIVVDDGELKEDGALSARYGGRYVSLGAPQGLNVARNRGLQEAAGPLLVYVDDDVEVRPGWLAALLDAAAALPDVDVFTGPIHARFEDHALRLCGREGPPITFLDLGPDDTDTDRAWGANLAVRRSAFEALGPFDPTLSGGGDETQWLARYRERGGRIRYVAAAALDHRRAGDDARLRNLMRAAYRRGAEVRRIDERGGQAPSVHRELRTLAGCVYHAARRGCAGGLVLAAHSAGRLRAAVSRAGRS